MATVDQVLEYIDGWLLGEGYNADANIASAAWQDTGLDSLELMALVSAVEQAFSCSLPNDALRFVQSFGDLAVQVAKRAA